MSKVSNAVDRYAAWKRRFWARFALILLHFVVFGALLHVIAPFWPVLGTFERVSAVIAASFILVEALFLAISVIGYGVTIAAVRRAGRKATQHGQD